MFTKIESERLILRRFKESDTKPFYKYRTNPSVMKYQSDMWIGYTLDKAREFVKEQMNSQPGIPGTWFQIAIELKDMHILIGDCAIYTLKDDINQAEIGYTISPDYQRKGYGKEAVLCLLAYLFDVMNMQKIIAVTDIRNAASISLLESIGMKRETELSDEYVYTMLNERNNHE